MKFQVKLYLGQILAGMASNGYTGYLVSLVMTEENLSLLLWRMRNLVAVLHCEESLSSIKNAK